MMHNGPHAWDPGCLHASHGVCGLVVHASGQLDEPVFTLWESVTEDRVGTVCKRKGPFVWFVPPIRAWGGWGVPKHWGELDAVVRCSGTVDVGWSQQIEPQTMWGTSL